MPPIVLTNITVIGVQMLIERVASALEVRVSSFSRRARLVRQQDPEKNKEQRAWAFSPPNCFKKE
jgi:hypothetical protein